MTVLVVDDDPDVRALIELALRSDGMTTAGAGDGEAALEWLRTHDPPAAVVLDVQMPRIDGWTLLTRLRASQPDLPVLMCTVKIRDAERAGDRRVAFLAKPFSVEQLTAAVRGVLTTTAEEERQL